MLADAETSSGLPAGVRLEEVGCPTGCPPDDEVLLVGSDLLHGVPGTFRVVRCRTCRLGRTTPRPTPDSIGVYYPPAYAPHADPGPMGGDHRTWRHRLAAVFARCVGGDVRRLPPMRPGHVLDVGCASGAYLSAMAANGWSTEGIESSETAAARARAQGHQIQTGTIETILAPHRTPDLITAWMVLEHIHDLTGALQRLRAWVTPGGYLVGVVPDVEAFDARLFGELWYCWGVPTHLHHFSPESLRTILERGGWRLDKLRWQPNETNLLITLERWGQRSTRPWVVRSVRWLRTSRRAVLLRRLLGWSLGVTRQSGRMEFWARAAT